MVNDFYRPVNYDGLGTEPETQADLKALGNEQNIFTCIFHFGCSVNINTTEVLFFLRI